MSDIKDLLERYVDGQLSAEEVQIVLNSMDADESAVPDLISDLLQQRTVAGLGDPGQEEALFARIMEKDRQSRIVPLYRRLRWWAAAAILILGAAGTYYALQQRSTHQPAETALHTNIPAGRKGAVLTLSNGEQMSLDSAGKGVIAMQNGVRVTLGNGQLLYGSDSAALSIAYNKLSTPRGREFSITLPDGTKAWLNSSSSIKYPTAFSGKERNVEVTGEVYFEVAANASQPFRVKISNDVWIDVLGTSFNINAYTDEKNIVTTLAEGAIRFNLGQQSKVLSPGQQAVVANTDKRFSIQNANVEQVLAWKNGFFDFNHMPFDQVMRQLSRWYDIDVVYENGIPDVDMEGTLGRDVSLDTILFFLGKVDVHCRLEGKRLVISQ